MNLHAAFVPPASVRAALVDLVQAQEPAQTAHQSGQAGAAERRGLFGRRTSQPATPPSGPMLSIADPEQLLLPITDFGNVASGDARRVVDALALACSRLPPGPTVTVSGGAALIDDEDRSVWADLSGSEDDLAALRDVARAVVSAVEPLGLFCDRRQFRPRFPIATITEATTVEHLEQVLEALAAYTSEPWTVDELAVVQRGSGVWRTVPIGG